MIPAPTPKKALTAINCVILPHTKYNAPLKRNSHNPMYNKRIYPTLSLIKPANNIKGIISNDGNVVSIWISTSDAFGKITASSSDIGDTARPGKDVNADTDHIPNNAHRVIYPFPVSNFLMTKKLFVQKPNNCTAQNVASS